MTLHDTPPRRTGPNGKSEDFPWWLVTIILIGIALAVVIAVNGIYAQVFSTVAKGIGITVSVTLAAFTLAALLGLALALVGMADNIVLRQVARFYIEVVRGIPIIVLLFYIAFVGTPGLVALYNWLTFPLVTNGWLEPLMVRDVSLTWRAIIALTIGYAAFIAEIFRAGIQAVPEGQIEAAKALGFSRYRRFRLIILPQAIRTIFPPLSNDFVSMVKDSSLVSVLGVTDITQMGKVYAAGSFRFFETYSIVAYIYLILTIGLSLMLRRIEKAMRSKRG
ncbi:MULTISPECIES: amino acid ABC transporter permease [Rhizobium/Agrobacterium group]|uniref:Polar amino acid ABC transporter inner membrane subunit n=1 Tax=Agrobacterium tomkonis CFBP 6623 TaxID=1183432 RepID=A0A1S7P439_9HYPH|nr:MULTISPECIES: amino acid ABC transporter permease [Rhizobium/Agrobacterium group]MCA2375831.1 amino acid ABC transporter permease [Agrobacterium tomkonis RTP8]KNY34209.1 amino acid ABC transporter [Agrobacterium sp. SUL3]KRA56956.1 amino acid ABC transporter [Rhizobium sp. Root651]MCD4662779.1 amino acid ABC transporter permease [Agrobacterium sp.]QCL89967.1 amino acid ABC transporter permease [Agrobacterium tumefaciens]